MTCKKEDFRHDGSARWGFSVTELSWRIPGEYFPLVFFKSQRVVARHIHLEGQVVLCMGEFSARVRITTVSWLIIPQGMQAGEGISWLSLKFLAVVVQYLRHEV